MLAPLISCVVEFMHKHACIHPTPAQTAGCKAKNRVILAFSLFVWLSFIVPACIVPLRAGAKMPRKAAHFLSMLMRSPLTLGDLVFSELHILLFSCSTLVHPSFVLATAYRSRISTADCTLEITYCKFTWSTERKPNFKKKKG